MLPGSGRLNSKRIILIPACTCITVDWIKWTANAVVQIQTANMEINLKKYISMFSKNIFINTHCWSFHVKKILSEYKQTHRQVRSEPLNIYYILRSLTSGIEKKFKIYNVYF